MENYGMVKYSKYGIITVLFTTETQWVDFNITVKDDIVTLNRDSTLTPWNGSIKHPICSSEVIGFEDGVEYKRYTVQEGNKIEVMFIPSSLFVDE